MYRQPTLIGAIGLWLIFSFGALTIVVTLSKYTFVAIDESTVIAKRHAARQSVVGVTERQWCVWCCWGRVRGESNFTVSHQFLKAALDTDQFVTSQWFIATNGHRNLFRGSECDSRLIDGGISRIWEKAEVSDLESRPGEHINGRSLSRVFQHHYDDGAFADFERNQSGINDIDIRPNETVILGVGRWGGGSLSPLKREVKSAYPDRNPTTKSPPNRRYISTLRPIVDRKSDSASEQNTDEPFYRRQAPPLFLLVCCFFAGMISGFWIVVMFTISRSRHHVD